MILPIGELMNSKFEIRNSNVPDRFRFKNFEFRISNFGFSLLELLLVIIILAVIAGLTVPHFSQSYTHVLITKTADDIAYSMRYAQSRAVTRGHRFQLQFDDTFQKYWITEEESEEQLNPVFKRISGKMGKTYAIPEGVEVRAERSTIDFLPNGNIQKARIQLESKNNVLTISTADQKNHVLIYTPDESNENS